MVIALLLRNDRGVEEMTIEQARECIPNIKAFENEFCNNCTENDWYCPYRCHILEKAWKLDRANQFDRILKSYARNDGDLKKVRRFLREVQI